MEGDFKEGFGGPEITYDVIENVFNDKVKQNDKLHKCVISIQNSQLVRL